MATLLQVLEWCVKALEETGQCRQLVRESKETIHLYKTVRSLCGKAGKGKSGRPPMELPWADIDAERKRHVSWKEISQRLEAAGYPISRSGLIYRNQQRRRPVRSVK